MRILKAIIMAVMFLIIVAAVLTPRDRNRYSTEECMEDYRYFMREMSKNEEGSLRWKEAKYVLDNGFYMDKDSVIYERPNINDIMEEGRGLK